MSLENVECLVGLGQTAIENGVSAEVLIPGHWLMRYDVTFDYPGQKFSVETPTRQPKIGSTIPALIHFGSGFPYVELQIDGENYGFLLDTGASCTMISESVLQKWMDRHPEWIRAEGAVGFANMFGTSVEASAVMMKIPQISWGHHQLHHVTVVSRPAGTFENRMSQWMRKPIEGALAGNAVKDFRMTIAYEEEVIYVERLANHSDANELQMVGLTLRCAAEDTIWIDGISAGNGVNVREVISPGAELVSVNSVPVRGMPMHQVVGLLQGQCNEEKQLSISKDGHIRSIIATVVRLLG